MVVVVACCGIKFFVGECSKFTTRFVANSTYNLYRWHCCSKSNRRKCCHNLYMASEYNSGTTWTNITGYVNTTNTSFSNIPGSSRSYQVIANDPACGIITTAAASLTLISDPVLTVTPSNNNFCAGGNTTLNNHYYRRLGTNSYQWQQYIGTTWTNIASATGASYTGTNLSATTSYRANLTQSISGCGASTISAITVKTLPNITTSPAAPHICVGGTVSIAAAGGSNYSWSPATGLNAATGSPVVASGTTSTTYSLTGTGTNGCTKTISVPE